MSSQRLPEPLNRTCAHCGQPFNTIHAGRVYCSVPCSRQAQYQAAVFPYPQKGSSPTPKLHL